ncbi:MAG TPA: hypothetical protein PKD61_11800 [Polyangiaceae bacterium]|nr:hypothetical protein [Polyangiaceae bacterium]
MLRFSFLGFPVGIQHGFWILALFIAISPGSSIQDSLAWIGIIFVSVMVHELGHAFAARAYGQEPVITLHMMGGLTSWMPSHELGRKSRILITLAGPMAGFALAALSFGVLASVSDQSIAESAQEKSAVADLSWKVFRVNMFWSVINLMPVLPFDGGQIMSAALGPQRKKITATVSLIFGLVTAFVFFRLGSLFGAAIFGIGGVSSFMAAMRSETPELPDETRHELAVRAKERLDAQDFPQAAALARVLMQAARRPEERLAALEITAWAALGEGNQSAAVAAVRELISLSACDPYLQGAVALADGDQKTARSVLERARESGDRRPELVSLSVRVELEAQHFGRATELGEDLIGLVEPSELRQVAAAAAEHDAHGPAARLLEAVFEAEGDAEDAFAAAQGFARADQVDDALRTLSKAVKAGHPDAARAGSDADFRRLADDPRFAQALAGEELPAV